MPIQPSYIDSILPPPSPKVPSISAARFMHSMRRSFSSSPVPRKRGSSIDIPSPGMYSTPEERTPISSPHYSFADSDSTRPSVEQIAMGLHISRTPHLRPSGRHQPQRNSAPASHSSHHGPKQRRGSYHGRTQYGTSPRHEPPTRGRTIPPLILPPPPPRSSMKKSSTAPSTPTHTPDLSVASQSTLTVTSTSLSTPWSASSFRLRIAKLLHGSLSLSTSSSGVNSPGSSESEDKSTPKKAVRFSMSVGEVSSPEGL